jgi:hypothetical protein
LAAVVPRQGKDLVKFSHLDSCLRRNDKGKNNSPSILLPKDEPSLQRREIMTGRDACPTGDDNVSGFWFSLEWIGKSEYRPS